MAYDDVKLKNDLKKLIHDYEDYLGSIRTGRANPRPFQDLHVDPYETGTTSPLQAFATVSTDGPLTILINPYDASVSNKLVEAIKTMPQTFNPVNEGTLIRIPIPPLTEESRADIVKTMKLEVENMYKKRLRQVRQEYMQKLEKDETLSEDMISGGKKRIQELIDHAADDIDRQQSEKEEEIMSISA